MAESDEYMGKRQNTQGERFAIRELIGQGGVGRVFLAYDAQIQREVAIKELIEEKLEQHREKKTARFLREARLCGQLEHPGIVPVYELTQKPDGSYFYVMRRVQGRTLAEALVDSTAGTPEGAFRKRMRLLDSLIDVCEAMGFAHSKEVIHRDLKPQNIVLGAFGETIILDWGLAKHLKHEEDEGEEEVQLDTSFFPPIPIPEEAETLTRQGALLGTPSYMAPEQVDARFGRVDAASDVYALGTILYMILTGKRPYPSRGRDVLKYLMHEEFSPDPRKQGTFVPPELAVICQKAMAKRKAERFQNASQLAEELKAYRDGRMVSVYAYSKKELLLRFLARNRVAIGAAMAVMLSIMIGAGFSLTFALQAQRARLAAEGALEEVTTLSEASLMLSRRAVSNLDAAFRHATDAMRVAAAGFSQKGRRGGNFEEELQTLLPKFPNAEALLIVKPDGEIASQALSARADPSSRLLLNGSLLPSGFHERDERQGMTLRVLPDARHFVISVKMLQGGRAQAFFSALYVMEHTLPSALGFQPLLSEYQIWCMDADGTILYDEDPAQIGKGLFTDEMYASFPELLAFGGRMQQEAWGVGHYAFHDREGAHIIYRVAAWDTFQPITGVNWKLVVTHPYVVAAKKSYRLMPENGLQKTTFVTDSSQ